jgi:iron complex transport system substrate-binding protein
MLNSVMLFRQRPVQPALHRAASAILLGLGLGLGCMAQAQAFPVTVDSCGEKLVFNASPKAAMIHDLNMTDMALALKLQSQMAAVSGITGWYKPTPEFKKALGSIPEVAPKQPTLENVLSVKPDFFFAGWNYGMKVGGDVTPATLKKYNIPTLVLSESCVHIDKTRPRASMDLLYTDFIKLGTIFGKQAQATAQVADWKKQLAALPKPAGKEPVRMFLFDSGEDKPFTAGRFAIPTAMMETVGGRNVMEDLDTSWGTVSWEAVAARNPEFLILLDYANDGGAEKLLKFLQAHPLMQYTDAVKNKRFVALRYEELTPGPANITAIEKMAKALKL